LRLARGSWFCGCGDGASHAQATVAASDETASRREYCCSDI
jgi:hypothetical protein